MMACKLNRVKFTTKYILAISVVVGCSNAFAQDAGKAPGFNFPGLTSSYLLQDFNGRYFPEEVALTKDYQSTYFYSNCYSANNCYRSVPEGSMVFFAPSGFKSTPNSSYPRVELRAKRTFNVGQEIDVEQSGSVFIVQNPKTKSIIFAQIHGDKSGGSELLKLRWKDGAIVAGIKSRFGDSESQSVLLAGVKLNEKIDYKIEAKGKDGEMRLSIKVSVNGNTSIKEFLFQEAGWEGVNFYFKAGNYNQTSDPQGAAAIVAYSAINIEYR
ncbi:MAG TPA: polysaccharide lyase family 7 protein [Pseudomonas sp.]|nr:polysaccharide lyase family 7 protein [Pseudomonas sp.]